MRHRAFVVSVYFFFFLAPTISNTTTAMTATTNMALHRPMLLVSQVSGLAQAMHRLMAAAHTAHSRHISFFILFTSFPYGSVNLLYHRFRVLQP